MSSTIAEAIEPGVPAGRFIDRDGRRLYELRGVDAMEPFLMTLNCDSDLWMFASSRGAFTAGRVQPDWCVFPYVTDDELHTLSGTVGPITMVRFADGRVWRPLNLRPGDSGAGQVLRRSPIGDRIEFEETDAETGMIFRVEYGLADEFGIVRACTIEVPEGRGPISFELLDGYRRVMPAGVPLPLQQSMSTLVEGYARSEFVDDAGLAVYTLESRISDVAAALEMLRANVVWRIGLGDAEASVDDDQLRAFERGEPGVGSAPALGRRGGYLCRASLTLDPGQRERWWMVSDARLDHCRVAELSSKLSRGEITAEHVERALDRDSSRLSHLVDDADGAQVTADDAACSAHRCNVLFNAMRGGVPLDGFRVKGRAFRKFVQTRHASIARRHESTLSGLVGRDLTVRALADSVGAAGDPQLTRLALEYLPLTFARRHGDPSRPWNRYRIKIRDEQGDPIAAYEGNWRDIFQNWEAMSRAYPELLPGMVTKFVNASTLDGYNPYRINEHGIDWEKPEPGNEWANIGYWGDHQVIYLLRLLQQCQAMRPDWLAAAADLPAFSYANVPYRQKSFEEIARDPRRSIEFDEDLDGRIDRGVGSIGDDARLVLGEDDEPLLVTLVEKLLVPALAKVSNLVPGGGVWMNTQRPEWNDANNALAGFGLSMVTLYQLRSYCDFLATWLDELDADELRVSSAIAAWMNEISAVIKRALEGDAGPSGAGDAERWEFVRRLGLAAERARTEMYAGGPGSGTRIGRAAVVEFFRLTRDLCDDSIRGAKREDGLYHSYNVLQLAGGPESRTASIRYLSEMLEGQVAVLSCGVLSPGEAADVLDALAASRLYREDQRAYMLYPRVELPAYLARNVIPEEAAASSSILRRIADAPEVHLILRDVDGRCRFGASIESHDALEAALATLARDSDWADAVAEGAAELHDAFEQTFHHAEFTGRSGRMHKYEGLGSIFWHMYAKLVLAVQECTFEAADSGADRETLSRLRSHYAAVRDGLGFRKSPAVFGAVPYEPYSHTPWKRCAQQPGMSGQVKEGILARYGELGVRVRDGALAFDPLVLAASELLGAPSPSLRCVSSGEMIEVPARAVGLTVCGVPVIVRLAERDRVLIRKADETIEVEGNAVPGPISRAVFARTGEVARIEAEVRPVWPDQAQAVGLDPIS